MRILELPFQLCPNGEISIAVLNERPDVLAVAQQIYVGINYSFASGTLAPSSYNLLTAHNRFAQRGILAADYSADTHTIDEAGITVQLQGVDTDLDEQSDFNALADEFIAIVDDEIFSVSSVAIVDSATYQLQVVRSRFATARADHLQGADVYLIRKADILPLQHPSFLVASEISLKVVVNSGSLSQELEDVDAITYTIQGTNLMLVPCNLRVNDWQTNPFYTAGQNVRIDWSIHFLRSDVFNVFGTKMRTLLEILSEGGDVLWKKYTYANTLTILAAKMATILGGRDNFKVRVSGDSLSSESRLTSEAVEVLVLKR